MHDAVNHPDHYKKASVSMEPLDICRYLPHNQGDALAYVCRARYKENYVQDLEKAQFLLEDAETYLTEEDWPKSTHVKPWNLLKFYCTKTDNELIYESMLEAKDLPEFFYNLQIRIAHELKP